MQSRGSGSRPRESAVNPGTLRERLACGVCWRTGFATFLILLAAESLVLMPAAIRFQRIETQRMAERAESRIELALALAGGDAATAERELAATMGELHVEALAVYTPAGVPVLALGAPPPAFPQGVQPRTGSEPADTRTSVGSRLESAWASRSAGTPVVAVRLDASSIRGELVGYLMRMGALLVLVALIGAGAAYLIVHRGILGALLRLRSSALLAADKPERASEFTVQTRRRDEMGELIGAYNKLLARLSEAKKRDRAPAGDRYLARHQPLTGLPNRQALMEYLNAAQSGADARTTSLLLLNLEQFPILNSTLGAERCDELLRQMAVRLRRAAPSRDFVAHIGADRFVVVHDASPGEAGAAEIAQALLKDLAAHYELGGTELDSLNLRIGIAHSEGQKFDGGKLLDEAERALAGTAAADGPNPLRYSSDLAAQARERKGLAGDLQRALKEGGLFPVLQPKWALQDDGGVRLSGAEALVRWRHSERGLVPPDQFIPLAESIGLMEPISEFMLRSTCRAIRQWIDRFGRSPSIAINLTADQFADPALSRQLSRALDAAGIGASSLELEVTEPVAMKDVVRSAARFQTLRELGVKVSIADFGSGHSSLTKLRRFEVDAIKLDKSFVANIGSNRNADTLCDAILRLAQSLGAKVIAEGVETKVQMAFLRQRRCDEVQGYLLGRPVPLEEFEKTYIEIPA